ncbi:hypothetical protein G6F42_016911 [Rhizopus arrhizus]|nr:hypothetical protein G6F42_016911 [Rhizopus arrhizus]
MSSKIGTNKSKGASPGSTSQASNVAIRGNICLPPPQVIATTIADVLQATEAIEGAQEQGDQSPKYPVIIESCAASY